MPGPSQTLPPEVVVLATDSVATTTPADLAKKISPNAQPWCRAFLTAVSDISQALQAVENTPNEVPGLFARINQERIIPMRNQIEALLVPNFEKKSVLSSNALTFPGGQELVAKLDAVDAFKEVCSLGVTYHQHMNSSALFRAYRTLVGAVNTFSKIGFALEVKAEADAKRVN